MRALLCAALLLAVPAASGKGPAPAADKASRPAARPGAPEVPDAFDDEPAPGTLARCPITGEPFRTSAGTRFVRHGGRVFAFCCEDCAREFEANPGKFGG
jgi:hypothetical protein